MVSRVAKVVRNKKHNTVFGDVEYDNLRYLNEDNPWDHWNSMPTYDPKHALTSEYEVEISFDNLKDVAAFSKQIGHNLTPKTKSVWYNSGNHDYTHTRWICDWKKNGAYKPENKPKYPIYIPSKSRPDIRLTSDYFIELGVEHYIIVEASQYEQYAAKVDPRWVTLLILPQKYLDEYDTCDDLGATKSKGPGAARNFAWDHSIALGAARHWVIDDNQAPFFRHNEMLRTPTLSAAMFRAMEDHSDRYENVYISGPHYKFFVIVEANKPPFLQNCRIYSTLLIKNDIPYRWRGRYNEDTDLSLRVLKDGFCTIQYNAFTMGKMGTQVVKGGNTEAFYGHEGTMPKSKMLVDLHPDACKLEWRYGRWHHVCDYDPYRANRLVLKSDYYVNPDSEYGMEFTENYGK